jgi:DNA-binding MarR family transcriptional regulator
LHEKLVAKLKALGEKDELLRELAASGLVTPREGLTSTEIMVLAILAGSCLLPNDKVSIYIGKRDAEKAGVTNVGYTIAIKKLLKKRFIKSEEIIDEENGERYQGVYITESGWDWVEANESEFILHRVKEPDPFSDDDIPF